MACCLCPPDEVAPDPDPHRIRLLCWNIEGLENKRTLVQRTLFVCNTINRKRPNIVFLQEVIPQTAEILQSECPDYELIAGGQSAYFTAIMLQTAYTDIEDSTIIPFKNSVMLRNLLIVKCTIKGVKLELICSHLESTEPAKEERKRQLVAAFERMKAADARRTVIFGGDLNLEDQELREVWGIPEGLFDLWEANGRNPDTMYT